MVWPAARPRELIYRRVPSFPANSRDSARESRDFAGNESRCRESRLVFFKVSRLRGKQADSASEWACFSWSRATGSGNGLVFFKISGSRGERVDSTSARPRLRKSRLISAKVSRHRERVGSFATKSRDIASEWAHLWRSRETLPEISSRGPKQARAVTNKPAWSQISSRGHRPGCSGAVLAHVRPMSRDLGAEKPPRPQGSRFRGASGLGALLLAALQAAGTCASLTQGIGLRPKPWAWVSRPVGPVPLCVA
jgi:hypothetical protein